MFIHSVFLLRLQRSVYTRAHRGVRLYKGYAADDAE